MPWLELSLTVDAHQQPAVEDALQALGALAVTLADADADSADEHAIFEPGVGEVPLWARTRMQALFATDADRAQLVRALAAIPCGIQPAAIDFRDIDDQPWERAWMDRFHPMRFGRRLWIYPWNVEPAADDTLAIVRLDPGLAFGTGTHPTTALCLEWLDGMDLSGLTLVDYGCGSGVLAVAALKLGAVHVIGVDNDPQALIAARDNAARNGVGARLDLCLPDACPGTLVDACVANILADTLATLAPRIAGLCKAGAPLALSGILDGQQPDLLERYAAWFRDLSVKHRGDWVRVDGYRKS